MILIALIIIDMQEDYIGEKSKNSSYSNSLIVKINERISCAAKQNEMIIYIKNKSKRKKSICF